MIFKGHHPKAIYVLYTRKKIHPLSSMDVYTTISNGKQHFTAIRHKSCELNKLRNRIVNQHDVTVFAVQGV